MTSERDFATAEGERKVMPSSLSGEYDTFQNPLQAINNYIKKYGYSVYIFGLQRFVNASMTRYI